ncbi:DNA repair protein RadA [Acetonema longum]|uniref:DNA repair protein RadA n=1 Tax=Acetonema longum DSM 6540 TaxID=1009370 RepID=F7NM75_9FIRM|nr:DNA repair protein RadA [Acetonema longum]EGO62876.1 DNA repair protein RadA [Acetonema longum DSM 6540]
MAKPKIVFVCQECGHDSPKWLGRCPNCGGWNTMVEEMPVVAKNERGFSLSVNKPCPVVDIATASLPRRNTGVKEFDRVLGGGVVPGSLVLVGGDPGIGKSTLMLQVATGISRLYGNGLYVSGEESAAQVRMRAERLGELARSLYIMTETNIDAILAEAGQSKPAFLVIDSIQTMFCPDIPSAPGSVGQVRESTAKLLRYAKETNVPVAIIGHVTKEGNIAGPRLLEHMVDVVLYFEGERNYSFRVLRAIKNRFGSTTESGIFAMEEQGLMEIKNPSQLLLSERPDQTPGSVVLAYLEGVRPLLIEMQALVSTTCFGMPRRTTVGFDYNRLAMLMAVLEKRVGLSLANQDAYVNAVGGIRVTEPAADLAVALAVASSFRNQALNSRTVVVGEVGLTGEVRMVSRMDARIAEAATLGFVRAVIPKGNLTALKVRPQEMELIGVGTVAEAMAAML